MPWLEQNSRDCVPDTGTPDISGGHPGRLLEAAVTQTRADSCWKQTAHVTLSRPRLGETQGSLGHLAFSGRITVERATALRVCIRGQARSFRLGVRGETLPPNPCGTASKSLTALGLSFPVYIYQKHWL